MLPFYSAILTVLRLKRTCTHCGKDFVLHPGDRQKEIILCPHCKKKIPNKAPKQRRDD